MTPSEQGNAICAQCRHCTGEIKKAMSKKPKPPWDATVKPIIKKHHQQISPWASVFLSSSLKLAA